MKTYRKAFLFAVVSLLFSGVLRAQENEFVPLRELKPLEISEEILNPFGFDVGLNINQVYFSKSQPQPNDLHLGTYRPYLLALLNENHLFTARGRINFTYNHNAKTEVERTRTIGSLEVFSLDYNITNSQSLRVGRGFYKVGRGLLFANFGDGLEYSVSARWGQLKGMAVYSAEYGSGMCAASIQGCGDRNPFIVTPGLTADANLPDLGKRFFYAFEYQTPSVFWGSRLVALGMYSQDLDTGKNSLGQQFSFNPFYASIGARGMLFIEGLRYMVNYYYQGGSSYTACANASGDLCRETPNRVEGTSSKTDISAHAVMADVNYSIPFFEHMLKPSASLQYAYASGDADRTRGDSGSQANRTGVDSGFYHFGAFSGGLGLLPRLHNMHAIRAGVNFRPLHSMYAFRNLLVGLKYSIFRKAVAAGPTSDPMVNTGVNATANLGSGYDMNLVWDFRSDLKFFYGLGIFVPSDAYKADKRATNTTHIVSLTVNL